MAADGRLKLGALGESLAARHLERAGYEVLARNYRTRFGELDVVAADDGCLVFCEVKTRASGTLAGPSGPLEAIGAAKRRQLRAMARQWLSDHAAAGRPRSSELRFDAIGVTFDRRTEEATLEHVQDAF